jgi:adenine-specific DNA-methyltransferase
MPTLQFKGKSFVQNHHLAVKFHQLVGVKGKSLTDKVSLHDNLIVQGDNLKALKALLPTYAGKVKCIYIDPPYNTGKVGESWVYWDNVNSPMMQDWFDKVVDREDLTRHDKWCCMLMPRLKLLRELLTPDGTIFVSIDNNEEHRLRLLMDEVFNSKNHIGTIIWKNVTDNNPATVVTEHEYIIAYANDAERLPKEWKSSDSDIKDLLVDLGKKLLKKHKTVEEAQEAYTKWFAEHKWELGPLDRYKHIDEGGIYTGSQSVHNPGRIGYRYDVIHPVTKKSCKIPLMGYRFPESTMKELLAGDRVLYGEDENKIIELKVYAYEYEDKLPSVINLDGRIGANALKDLFPEKEKVFNNPKPFQLLEQILSFATSGDDIVLDSFGGSGTTGHAVLNLNKKDGGKRRFVLVQMPQEKKEETEQNITDEITAERVRRVIKGVPKSKNFQEGTGGSFSYFKLGAPIEMEHILHGDRLPSYEELARYVFYTATGEEFNEADISTDKKKPFIGKSKHYPGGVYLFYEPRMEHLMNTALTLDMARALGKHNNKRRLVFAPMKYLDQDYLDQMRIDYSQLPFEIYKFKG